MSEDDGRLMRESKGVGVRRKWKRFLASSAPGTTGPNHTGRLNSPGIAGRPSNALTFTSSIAPFPTTVNVFTWQLSHTMRN